MKKNTRIWTIPFAILVFFLQLTNCYSKDNKNLNNNNTPPDSVIDIEGNIYKTVNIGTQDWMVENLKTTKYNSGKVIQLLTDSVDWQEFYSAGYCWYNNDSNHKNVFGALYNWEVINSDILCPTGWHVPNDSEWTILQIYLGGYDSAGGKLKEKGTTHWKSPNTGGTNVIGFTALPGGYRSYNGDFKEIGICGSWWSSNKDYAGDSYNRFIYYDLGRLTRGFSDKRCGFSVRCIKDK